MVRLTICIAWWIAFGPHGPRADAPPGEWTKVFLYTAGGVGISVALFFIIHSFARPPPRTMTKEWQEATNEYLKVRMFLCIQRAWSLVQEILTVLSQSENSNPIYGISSEQYSGKGHVQSKSAKAQGISLDAAE